MSQAPPKTDDGKRVQRTVNNDDAAELARRLLKIKEEVNEMTDILFRMNHPRQEEHFEVGTDFIPNKHGSPVDTEPRQNR